MNDKVTKFGNCAHNIAATVEYTLNDPSEFAPSCVEDFVCNAVGSLDLFEHDFRDSHPATFTELGSLAEAGMAGAALLLGLKGQVSKLANQMTDLYARKNRDYGNSFDKSMDKFGLVVAAIRIGDKVNRLLSLVAKRGEAEVKDENMADTFIDLACYAIMTLMWMEGKVG